MKTSGQVKDPVKSVSKKEKVCGSLSLIGKEAYRKIRTNLIRICSQKEEKCHVVGITSSRPTEGKSSVAVNLSYSLAELGLRVLLIDADMRRPSVHEKLLITGEIGLSDILLKERNFADTVKRYTDSVHKTAFDVITVGNRAENSTELLDSREMLELIESISVRYDYIILDLPPVGVVIDAVSVSECVSGMVFVVRENFSTTTEISDCVSQLRLANINIYGFVVNGTTEGAVQNKYYGRNYY